MFGNVNVERDFDTDMRRVWHMVQELSEQLAHNHKIVGTLQSQANVLKERVVSNGSGYSVRRFNVDLSQEVFESELEKQNAQSIIDNQTLQHENKQLSLLLKEYEQTMETVMSKFRGQAYAAQQHEVMIAKHYETLLQAQQTASVETEMALNSHVGISLQRLTHCLRLLLQSLGGEDPENDQGSDDGRPLEDLGSFLFDEEREDWALEREVEIARLKEENEELRRMLGVDNENAQKLGWCDEEGQLHRPILSGLKASQMAHLQDSWAQSPPESVGPSLVPSHIPPMQQQQQQQQQMQMQQLGQSQQQQPQQQNIPLQRQNEYQPGMRAVGTLRRPSILRGRGAAPPYSNWSAPAPPQAADRNWMPGIVNNGLDLAG